MREYRIEYLPEVVDDVQHLSTRELQAIKAKIEWLAVHFDEIPHQRLGGRRFRYKFKLRFGDYRVIYSFHSIADAV